MGGLIFTAIAVACIALQYLLPRYLPNWTGLFILVPYVAVVVFIVFTVGLHGFRDFIMPLAGFFWFNGCLGSGNRKEKTGGERGGT